MLRHLKTVTEIDVHQLHGLKIEHYVLHVSVSESENVSCNRRQCKRRCIRLTTLEPINRVRRLAEKNLLNLVAGCGLDPLLEEENFCLNGKSGVVRWVPDFVLEINRVEVAVLFDDTKHRVAASHPSGEATQFQ